MKLSVAMIVKNEESCLKHCLESVKDADEIVIVDTGSTDTTIEIAKEYTDKIFTDYVWEDHFANARNHALSKCTGDWVLSIDADDVLEPGGIAKIRAAILRHPDDFCLGIEFIAHGGHRTHIIPYLYKRHPEVLWKGAAHNYLSKAAANNAGVKIHYGYSPSHTGDPNRTLRILQKEVDEDPTKARETFYLAREYRYRKDWATSIKYCNDYLKIAHWNPEIADCWLMKARALWNLRRGEEARDACLQAIKINTNFREACLFMATMTGPINREKWLWMAEVADNSGVLFTRDKPEQPASYYEKLNDTEPRYDHLYEEVGRIIGEQTMIDIGCGQGRLGEHIKNYDGFDMVKNPYRIGNIYTEDLGDYEVYVLLEVLEHLWKDKEILARIPAGKKVVFSVPSFDCPSHVRLFTQDIVKWRYKELIDFKRIVYFHFDTKNRKWKKDAPITNEYILLCEGTKI